MKLAITGHRPNKLGNDFTFTNPIIVKVRREIIDTIMAYKSRMRVNPTTGDYARDLVLVSKIATGMEQLFVQIAIEFRIPFIAAIPYSNQEAEWGKSRKEQYRSLLGKAQNIHVASPHYYQSCILQCDRWMIDNCDLLIVVWDGTKGGTANCVTYAKSIDKPIIYIKPVI